LPAQYAKQANAKNRQPSLRRGEIFTIVDARHATIARSAAARWSEQQRFADLVQNAREDCRLQGKGTHSVKDHQDATSSSTHVPQSRSRADAASGARRQTGRAPLNRAQRHVLSLNEIMDFLGLG
jgi:hypothetical protein